MSLCFLQSGILLTNLFPRLHVFQADLQDLTIVRGVMTQGRNSKVVNQWVTQYRVLYSSDCNTWTYVGADLTDDVSATVFEPSFQKTNNLGFRPGQTQTRLYSHRSRIQA